LSWRHWRLDPVAYVRFASVYRDFREAADFHEVLGEIAAEPVAAHEAPRIAFDTAVADALPHKKH
jgi:transcriptional repressor NrdR